MHSLQLVACLPIELTAYVFSFFTIKEDLPLLLLLCSHPQTPSSIKAVIHEKILRFVVVDPSCWARQFTGGDFWFPSISELTLMLQTVPPCRQSTVQICIYHNYLRTQHELSQLLEVLSRSQSRCRVYARGSVPEINRILQEIQRCAVCITQLLLVDSLGREINALVQPWNDRVQKCQFPNVV